MTITRTAGILQYADGKRMIDKEYRGVRLFRRLGHVTQEQAEQRLEREIERLTLESDRKAHARPLFRHCAARYLGECKHKRSVESIAWHVRLLLRHFADVAPERIHDMTLRPFIDERLRGGAGAITVNRSLEVMRTILNRAARAYRDDDGRPWLERLPPLISMLAESPRPPCPITWEEQDQLFQRLPGHLQLMTLFAVNTGLRESNVCGLNWSWEVFVPEVNRSVFVIPPEAFKARRAHVVILNDAAWSIVASQKGSHPEWVFPFRGKRIRSMNNTAWQRARKEIGLPHVRIHDLRHTFGSRLRAAGVSEEDGAALLGHASRSMAGHYGSADIGRLIGLANRVIDRVGTRTILRVANG
jgi:integrase